LNTETMVVESVAIDTTRDQGISLHL